MTSMAIKRHLPSHNKTAVNSSKQHKKNSNSDRSCKISLFISVETLPRVVAQLAFWKFCQSRGRGSNSSSASKAETQFKNSAHLSIKSCQSRGRGSNSSPASKAETQFKISAHLSIKSCQSRGRGSNNFCPPVLYQPSNNVQTVGGKMLW